MHYTVSHTGSTKNILNILTFPGDFLLQYHGKEGKEFVRQFVFYPGLQAMSKGKGGHARTNETRGNPIANNETRVDQITSSQAD